MHFSHLTKTTFFSAKITLYAYVITEVIRFICFSLDWGRGNSPPIPKEYFWHIFFYVDQNTHYFIGFVLQPAIENTLWFFPFIPLVMLGEKYFPKWVAQTRLIIFSLLVITLFPYWHITEILTVRYINLVVTASTMVYAFLYTLKKIKNSFLLAYFASVVVHGIYNMLAICTGLIAHTYFLQK